MLEPAGQGGSAIRANLRVGGGSLARHQLGLAVALGCERVICVARGVSSDVVALQHAAEAAGARFHVVAGPRGLMGLVTSIDEVIAFTEGLLVSADDVSAVLEQGTGVFVQPVNAGLVAGFERIDQHHAAGGVLRVPARLIERLADLPPDCDTISALQRIALQSGIVQRPLPSELLESGRWQLVRDEIEAHTAERQWIRLQTGGTGVSSPSALVARQAVRSFGPALLHANSGGSALAIGAAVLALLALGTGWFGYTTAAFLMLGAGWAVRRTGSLLSRVERDSMQQPSSLITVEAAFEWMLDAMLVAIVVWNLPPAPDVPLVSKAFMPVMLVAMVRLVPRVAGRRWAAWVGDRLVLTVLLAGASLSGVLGEAVQGLTLALAVLGIGVRSDPAQITRA